MGYKILYFCSMTHLPRQLRVMQILFFSSLFLLSLLFFKDRFSGTFFFFFAFRLSQRWEGDRAEGNASGEGRASPPGVAGPERLRLGSAGRPLPGCGASNVHVANIGGRAGQVHLLLFLLLLRGLGVQGLLLGLAQAGFQKGFDLLLAGAEAVLGKTGWDAQRVPGC